MYVCDILYIYIMYIEHTYVANICTYHIQKGEASIEEKKLFASVIFHVFSWDIMNRIELLLLAAEIRSCSTVFD